MNRQIFPSLICPACLPRERPLELRVEREEDGDVVAGMLSCRACSGRFPIRDGIAVLLADPDAAPSGGQWRYEEGGTLATYLWSHYADLLGDPEAGDAYARWSDLLVSGGGAAIDAGCATGRLTFEMAARNELAVGCDLSLSFVRAARQLARDRQVSFSLPGEGHLLERFDLRLPDRFSSLNVEFLVADVLRLPFAQGTFSQTSSVNLIDRVRYPLAHLYEINRVARSSSAAFLFSDPFSWSEANAPVERWLGGTEQGEYPGCGLKNVRTLLEGKGDVIRPPWRVGQQGDVWWKIRSHRNHFELIRSQYLTACR